MTKTFGDCVHLKTDGAVATVTIDRGDGRNALSLKAMQALIDAAAFLRSDTSCNVIILSSAGAFTAGADLKDPNPPRLLIQRGSKQGRP